MNQSSQYLIGMDGGGTGCRVAISDADGKIVGLATGGAANYTSDHAGTARNLLHALAAAASSAGLSLDQLAEAPAHIGLAGIMSPKDAAAFAADVPLRHATVTDDQLIAVVGALGDRDGALVAIGTGSFVAVKLGDDIRYLGGWGLQLGDQASGAWIGRAILQRCAMVSDGLLDRSDMVDAHLASFDSDASALIAFARHASPAEYAKFAPVILDAAEAGDVNAIAVMAEGTDYLNHCLHAAQLADKDVVCLTGGIGPRFAQWLDGSFQARLTEPMGTALDGALHLARQMARAP